MRVQLQNYTFYPALGGIENYLYYSSKSLLKMGHEPTILCSRHIPQLPETEKYEDINIVRHPVYSPIIYPIYPFYRTFRFQKFIEKMVGIDIILSRHPHYAYASCKALKDIPTIYIQATVYPKYREMTTKSSSLISTLKNKSFIPQEKYIEKTAIELSDKVVVLSDMRLKEISDYYGTPKSKFAVIPPGVDLDRFKPRKKDYGLLTSLKIPTKAKIILTICRLAKGKNVEMIIKAFEKTNLKNSSYLVIVGDGPEKGKLEDLCTKLNLNQVIFVGRRNDVERFYSIADLFVLTSKYEGFGQVFLEAMASGVPCIGLKADYPEIIVASEEIILENENGFLADPYDFMDLAEKMDILISNDDLKLSMSEKARKTCEKHYSWDQHTKKLIKLIKSVEKS